MALKLITAPAAEPVTLTEAKAQCRVDSSDEDALLTLLIAAARRAAENRAGRALVTQTWELALDAFPAAEIELPMPPVQSITSIKYDDTSGVEQLIDAGDYTLDSYGSLRHWVMPVQGLSWPAAIDAANAVRIRFVSGYGAAADVPADIKMWMLLSIGTMYTQRETVAAGQLVELPGGFWQSLLDPYLNHAF